MNTIINKTKLHTVASVFAIAAMVLSLVPMQAFATALPNPYGDAEMKKIVLCHWDESGDGAYKSSGDVSVNAAGNGHDNHDEDIIPPYNFKDGNTTGFYPGKNWTVENAALWALGGDGNCGEDVVIPTTGTITIQKTVVNNNGGTATAGSFTYKIDSVAKAQGVAHTVAAGAHTVSEDAFAGYTPSVWGGACAANGSITVVAGQNYTCTITNDDNAPVVTTGTITVHKVIAGIEGVLKSAFNFIVNSGPSTAFDNDGVDVTVEAGEYSVSEVGETAGQITVGDNTYNVSYGEGCVGAIAANGTASCTITNTLDVDVPVPGCMDADANNYSRLVTVDNGSCLYDLTVTKVVTGNNEPNYSAFSFTVDGGSPVTFDAGNTKVVEVSSTTHDVVETMATGYSTTYSDGTNSDCTDIDVTAGNAVCTITNTLIPEGSELITACKYNDVTKDPIAGWGMTITNDKVGDSEVTFSLETGENGCISQVVNPDNGPFFVTEEDRAGWTQDGVEVTGGTVEEGQGANYCEFFPAPVILDQLFSVINIVIDQPITYDCDFYNSEDTVPPPACEVNVVSDTSNTYNDSAALVVTAHPEWVDNIVDSVATWIWGSPVDTVIDGLVDESQTFVKTFNWNGPVTDATLKLSTDNYYSVTLNGTVVASSTDEDNFTTTDTIVSLTDNIVQGTNTLEITVTNKANGATSLNIVDGNLAGLLYDLTVVGNNEVDCTETGGGGDELSCSITASDTSIRRGGDVTLSWTSVGASFANLLDNSVGTSSSLLAENIGADTTYTLTVYDQQEDSATCSVTVDTRSGGGGGGTRVDRDPDPEVLGDSDSAKPLVLGEQTSAVPTGAPNTGKGGSAMTILDQFLAIPRRRNIA